MDKNKIIEAAAKLVAKGSYDKAIKEYEKVLAADPKDVRVLQKMGELYQKKNDNNQAAHYFTKVAESYSSDGFFLKAVALYKQVLKLNPNLLEVNLKLAELHQQLGLMSEAMAYFQIVANHYDKSGDTKSSLDTLKRMVDLDPENVASKMKLAELYARENMTKEAVQEFKRAAEYLKRNARTDDYVRVIERLSTLEPDNIALAKEVAGHYLNKGDQKRALAKLQVAFKADGRDVETLNLLAQAFQGLGQTSKTVSVYKELAKVYQDTGRGSEANGVWDKIAALDPQDADLLARSAPAASARAPNPPRPAPAPAPAAAQPRPAPAAAPAPAAQPRPAPAPAPAPAPVAAQPRPAPAAAPAPAAQPRPAPAPAPAPAAAQPRPAPRPATPAPVPRPAPASLGAPPPGMTREQLAKLLTETDVYVKYGLHDKALEHLRKIFSVDPENLDAHEKAYNIYVAAGNTAQAGEQLLNVLRLCTRRAEAQRAQPYLNIILQQNPAHPEVPAFLAVLRTEQTGAQVAAPVESLGEDAILVESNDEEIVVAEPPEDALAQPAGDELALAAMSSGDEDEVIDDGSGEAVISDEALVGEAIVSGESEYYDPEDATSVSVTADESLADEGLVIGDEPTGTHILDEPLMAGAGGDEASFEDVEEPPSAEYVVDEPIVGGAEEGFGNSGDEPMAEAMGMALGDDDDPPPTRPAMPSAQLLQDAVSTGAHEAVLGDDDDMPTRVHMNALQSDTFEDEQEVTSTSIAAYSGEELPEEPATMGNGMAAMEPQAEDAYASEYQEPAAEASGEEDPAGEECDEAGFFLDQGLYDEAREILENVLIAIPGHPRASEMMERLEAAQAGGAPATEETDTAEAAAVPSVEPVVEEGERDAFDLAAELAEEVDNLGDEASAPAAAEDDFQYSVEEVFAEFKKGLEKVVKPEDVDTHYDLGIAYKEMGLSDDALGEFAVARKGCLGKPREVDCITMIGMLHGMRGEHAEAVKAFKEGLASEHAVGEVAKALGFELALAYEALGQGGKALYHYQRVAKLDAKYRDVSSQVSRLAATTTPEDDPLPPAGAAPVPPPAAAAGTPKARKVGYV